MNSSHPLSAARIDRILAVLTVKAMNAHDISAKIHLSIRWTYTYLTHLHKEGKIHIEAWEKRPAGNTYPVPKYRAGAGVDAQKPKPLTAKQKGELLRKRINADPERRDSFLARNRALKRKVTRMDLVAALFGAPAAASQ